MRVLDLGAHDGFVSAYVADKFEGDLLVDGIELNSHAAVIFRRRLAERRALGSCTVGRAEEAPQLLEPGSYDAVIAFELIEHVPDVPAFLDACEAMVKPNGRVYLSTPDGTFGEGQNPHHLRVYRAVDLADLLRRRGDVQAMGVGPDGITIASYTPWRALDPPLALGAGEVAIYCGPGWQTWSPLSIEAPGGLGGSETAAVRLGTALTRLGYTVTTYGEVEPGMYGQVVYRHHSAFDPLERRAAVICSRFPALTDRPVNAHRTLLWMHDTDYGPALTPQRTEGFDALMVLSEWHRGHVERTYPWASDKLVVTGNAIEPAYFTAEPAPVRNQRRAIYTSSPDRGLDLLLEMWPEVVRVLPDAELAYCYADVYQAVAGQRPEVAAFHERVKQLAERPDIAPYVRNLGALSQPEVARAMRESALWLAPSWTSWVIGPGQRFHETFCIGALEAAAAGCHRLASDWGALPERMREHNGDASWALIATDPTDPGWRDSWLNHIVGALGAPTKHVQLASALEATWDRRAEQFHRVIRSVDARELVAA